MKTKLQIIEETVAVYSNPESRAVRHDSKGRNIGCQYFQEETGNMCALGRCLMDAVPLKDFGGYAWGLAEAEGGGNLDSLLNEEYRGHVVSFWRDLQTLHDSDEHFTPDGYSQKGRDFIDRLKRTYSDS